jgi:hypothetical protein
MIDIDKEPFHYKLACLCERSEHEKTVEKSGVEVLVTEDDGIQYITPRSTESPLEDLLDVLRDLWVTRYKTHGIRGHEGVLRGAEDVLPLICKKLDKSKPVHLQGHSLGGAIGIPLLIMLDKLGYEIFGGGLVTFGCPLVVSRGHELFEKFNIVQYQYGNDVVPIYQEAWSGRTHIDVTHIGPSRSEGANRFWHRTWDDHGIMLYQKAVYAHCFFNDMQESITV